MRRARTESRRIHYSGCHDCGPGNGAEPQWFNAEAVRKAREHHDKTGHATWGYGDVSIEWGLRTRTKAKK